RGRKPRRHLRRGPHDPEVQLLPESAACPVGEGRRPPGAHRSVAAARGARRRASQVPRRVLIVREQDDPSHVPAKTLRLGLNLTILDVSLDETPGGSQVEPTLDEGAAETRRGAVRGLSVVVLVVLLIAAAGAAWATRAVVHGHEHRLLRERASELNLILSTATSNVQAQLANAGTAARLTNGSQDAFAEATKADVATTPGLLSEALLGPSLDNPAGFVVEAAVGPAYKVGDV